MHASGKVHLVVVCMQKWKKNGIQSLCVAFRTIKWKLARVLAGRVRSQWPPNKCMLRTQGKMELVLEHISVTNIAQRCWWISWCDRNSYSYDVRRWFPLSCCETLIFLPRHTPSGLPAVCAKLLPSIAS